MQQKLQHLDRQIQFLQEVAKQFPNPKLNTLVAKILKHRQNASRAIRLGQRQRAIEELKAAQRLVEIAMKIVISGPVARLREQLQNKIRFLEQRIHRHFNAEANRLLDKARKNQMRAEMAFRNQNIQLAMEYYRLAMFQVDKALQLMGGSGAGDGLQVVYEEQANFEDLHRRLQQMFQGAPTGVVGELYHQAMMQRNKAEQAMARGNWKQAAEYYRWATRLLVRVADMMGGGGMNARKLAQEEMQRLADMMRTIEQTYPVSTDPRLRRAYRQASRVFLDAQQAFARGDYIAAGKKLEVVRRILDRILQREGSRPGAMGMRLQAQLDQFKQLLAQLEREQGASPPEEVAVLLRRIRRYVRRCERALAQGHEKLARAYLLTAMRLADLMPESSGESGTGKRQKVEAAVRELEAAIRSAADKAGMNEEQRAWFAIAQDLYRLAQDALSRGDVRRAGEYARLGLRALQRAGK